MENIIELKHITKNFDDNFTAVDDFNLEVQRGEFVTFLGPSGCGKTTTLRMIAGFEMPTEGEILLNGTEISQYTKADLTKFLEEKGYKNPRVIAEKIKKNALIKYNGYFLYIVGMDARKNVEFSNATAMCLKYPYVQYICKLERLRAAMLLSEKQKMSLRWDEKVTGEKNLELYQELTTKHLHAIYADHPKCIGTCLENGESSFKLLGIEQQVMLLCDIVEYTSFQKGTFSLQAIGGQKEVGRIRISGNMTDATELKLIHYSITGMYKKEEDLLHM